MMYAFSGLQTVIKQIYAFFNLFYETLKDELFLPAYDLIVEFIYGGVLRLYYLLMAALMALLDLIQPAIGILSGGRKVSVFQGGFARKEYFLNVLLFNSGLSRAVWGVILISMIIGTVFTLVSLLGAMHSDDKQKGILKVMWRTGKVMMTFLVVPFVTIASINLSMLLFDGIGEMISVANGGSQETKLSSVVFMASTMGAQRNKNYGAAQPYDYQNEIRELYRRGERKYYDLVQVEQDFDIVKINFAAGIIAALWFIYVYLNLSLVFVYFLFQILMLFVVSPFFVSVMVLDDGHMFKKWRDLFLTRLIAGLGLVASIRLYESVILPVFTSDTFRFLPVVPMMSDIIGPEYFPDVFIKVFFLILFAKAVTKSHTIVTSIINEEAAQEEQKVSDYIRATSIKVAKKTVELTIDAAVIAASIAAGAVTAGAGTAAGAAAGTAAKAGVVAAKTGVKVGATAGKQAAKQVGKQAIKQMGKQAGKQLKKQAGKQIKEKALNKGTSAISGATDKLKGVASGEEQNN